MSTAIDWPRISIESQRQNQRSIGSQTKHSVRFAGTSDAGWILWNNLALANSGTVATRPYVACSRRYALDLNSWLVEAVPDDNDMALGTSGTVPWMKPHKACSWYAPNFSSWLVDTVPETIDAGQQSSATTLGTGAEWFGLFYATGSVRAERDAMRKEPVRIEESIAHGTAIRAAAEHFLKGTRDLTPKERSFLTRFYSRVHKKSK